MYLEVFGVLTIQSLGTRGIGNSDSLYANPAKILLFLYFHTQFQPLAF